MKTGFPWFFTAFALYSNPYGGGIGFSLLFILFFLRKNLDLSQEKLAEAANLTRESINRIENGSLKAKLDTIAVIASILNIPIEYLIGNEDDPSADAESELRSLLLDNNYNLYDWSDGRNALWPFSKCW